VSWVKLDDQFHSHPKVLELLSKDDGAWALVLWTLGLSHCGSHLTDGQIKLSAAVRLAGSPDRARQLAALLVEVRLWEVVVDGWLFHDYLDYNPSKAQVIAAEAARKRGGEEGARRRWRKGEAIGQAMGGPIGGPRPDPISPVPSRPVLLEEREDPPLASLGGPQVPSAKKTPAKTRGTRCPASQATEEEIAAWCEGEGIPLPNANPEVARMLDWHRSNGQARVDWAATWRNWTAKAKEFAAKGGGRERIVQRGGGEVLEGLVAKRGF
jgi:hypothetical protein